jgi:hypothetical protein
MADAGDVKHFRYRTPRYSFPRFLQVEIAETGFTRIIPAQGIDISHDGIAASISEPFPLDQPVTLAIPWGHDVLRVAGRSFYHSDDHYGFAFEFSSPEESQQIQDLVSNFSKTR